MDHMRIILNFLKNLNLHFFRRTAKVISGQIHQHNMLRVLLRIIIKFERKVSIRLIIAGTFKSTCNRINGGFIIFHYNLCFRRTAERSEEHTSELQSRENLVCRLLLEKKKKKHHYYSIVINT